MIPPLQTDKTKRRRKIAIIVGQENDKNETVE
jgi:hypothetical protein